MILLCGIPSESPIAMAREALASLAEPTVVFNQRDFSSAHFDFDLTPGGISGKLAINGNSYDLTEITGVYMRLIEEQALPEFQSLPSNGPEQQQCHNLHDALLRWLEITPARVVNRSRPMGSNASKPYQAQLISQLGFSIPETLITNDPTLVRDFCAQHGRVIYKSISGVRSIVQELTPADMTRLEQIRWCPTQFQAFVEGTNVRVHVIGKAVFATRIETDTTDYRYATRQGGATELTATELSDELNDRCIRLAAVLELPFAGIDLKITPDGEVFCFEVNPSPGYTYYESHTGQPIALALARYLAGK
jgi:glutathione synthase/RimK-type ligase-like ATP-grasp enzyme